MENSWKHIGEIIAEQIEHLNPHKEERMPSPDQLPEGTTPVPIRITRSERPFEYVSDRDVRAIYLGVLALEGDLSNESLIEKLEDEMAYRNIHYTEFSPEEIAELERAAKEDWL